MTKINDEIKETVPEVKPPEETVQDEKKETMPKKPKVKKGYMFTYHPTKGRIQVPDPAFKKE